LECKIKNHGGNQRKNMMQNITMESGGIELDGVEIVREMPVSIRWIPIVNTDSFKRAKSES
jgi:hypothetical protein